MDDESPGTAATEELVKKLSGERGHPVRQCHS